MIDPTTRINGLPNTAPERSSSTVGASFRQVLEGVRFSRHAEERMRSRQIQLAPKALQSLTEAMHQAQQAGSAKAAIVMPEGIFVVAPQNGTVITTLDHQPMQVITQVDTLVMVGRTSIEEAPLSRTTDGEPPAVHWSLIQSID